MGAYHCAHTDPFQLIIDHDGAGADADVDADVDKSDYRRAGKGILPCRRLILFDFEIVQTSTTQSSNDGDPGPWYLATI